MARVPVSVEAAGPFHCAEGIDAAHAQAGLADVVPAILGLREQSLVPAPAGEAPPELARCHVAASERALRPSALCPGAGLRIHFHGPADEEKDRQMVEA